MRKEERGTGSNIISQRLCIRDMYVAALSTFQGFPNQAVGRQRLSWKGLLTPPGPYSNLEFTEVISSMDPAYQFGILLIGHLPSMDKTLCGYDLHSPPGREKCHPLKKEVSLGDTHRSERQGHELEIWARCE